MGNGRGLLGPVGVGGIGKTTLAREIYNHYVAEKKFKCMTFLEIQRDPSSSNVQVRPTSSRKLRKQLLWDLLRVHGQSTSNYCSWFRKVSNVGPVFIVIHDVHNLGQFEQLVPCTSLLGPGSRIVFTSPDRNILDSVSGTSNALSDVSTLRVDESKMLFNWHAFHAKEAPQEYEDLAKGVVEACDGLPLALKVIGSTLFGKRSVQDRENIWPEAVDALRQSSDVMDVLRWSYNNLPDLEKRMFVDISCLFYDRSPEDALQCWRRCKNCSSCGGVKTPNISLKNLIDKNLVALRSDDLLFKVHDLLRDLGQEIGRSVGRHFVEDRIADGSHRQSSYQLLHLLEFFSMFQVFEH